MSYGQIFLKPLFLILAVSLVLISVLAYTTFKDNNSNTPTLVAQTITTNPTSTPTNNIQNTSNTFTGSQLGYIDTTNTNLITNSSFENQSENAPRTWLYMFASNNKNTLTAQEGSLTGNLGLKFIGGGNEHLGIMQPEDRLLSNRAYTFSTFVKTVNVGENTAVRLVFWDEANNKYATIKTFTFSGTQDWVRLTFTIDNRSLFSGYKWYPMIEVKNHTQGSVYVEDVELVEGTTATPYKFNAGGGQIRTASILGDGSVLIFTEGTIIPSTNNTGSLGRPDNRFQSLYLSRASIDKDGNLTVDGNATFNSTINLTGTADLNLTDNNENAFLVRQGSDRYIHISTKDNQEQLNLGNNSNNPTVNINSGTSAINIGANNFSKTINIGNGTGVDTLNIGNGGGADIITLGTLSGPGTTDIFSSLYEIRSNASSIFRPNTDVTSLTITPTVAQTTAIDLTDPDIVNGLSLAANDVIGSTGRYLYTNWNIAANGDITTAGDVAVNGGDITSTAATFNLLNQPTTINFAQAATTLSMGATTGNTTVRNNLFINGNTTLGDAATDKISFTGQVNTNILPDTDNTYDLGSTTLRWRSGFFGTSVVIGATTTITDGAITQSTSGAGSLTLQTTGGTDRSIYLISAKAAGQTTSEAFSLAATNNLGATDELFQLKDAGGDLLTIMGDGNVNFAGGITVAGTATFNGPLIANNTFQLGDGGDTGVINTSDWDISLTGDLTGIGSLTMDGNFSQTGATTFSTGTGAISLNGPTTITGTNTLTVGGDTSLNGNTTLGNAATDQVQFQGSVINYATNFFQRLEGATINSTVTELGLVDPTVNRQILFPDASGTVLLTTTPLFTLTGTSAGNVAQTLTAGDTITIEAGNNMTTVASATDRVVVGTVNNPVFTTSVTSPTFTNTGATTLSSQGGDITIDPSSGNVTLGASDNLTVPGNLTVTGTTSLNGIVNLGDAAADNITFNGRVASSILPNTDNTFDLGSPALRWRTGYFGTSVVIGATTTLTDGAITQSTSGTGNLTISTTGGTTGDLSLQSTGSLTLNGLTITPSTGTLTIANGKTLTVNNSLGFSGTDGTTFTFPNVSDTVVTLNATQTLANKSLTSPTITGTPTAAGSTWADLGSVTTIDINGGTIDNVAIANSTGSFTTLSSSGVTSLGNNTNTVAINSSDWDITATGDITGIGSLTIDGNFSQTGATTFSTGTGAVSLNGNTTVADGISLTANGNTILGNATTDTITFTGQVDSNILPATDATRNLGSAGNRWNEVWAANGTIQTSDARLKSNITGLSYGLDEVLRLNPVAYTLNGSSNTSLGFIAQDVQAIMPELVIVGNDTNHTLGLRYENMTSVLVKAVQQQHTQLKKVNDEVVSLNNKAIPASLTLDNSGNVVTPANLTVSKDLTVKGQSFFESVVEFISNVVFRGNVTFQGLAIFNRDTAGTAVIQKGADHVYVSFTSALPSTPMVNATISLDSDSDALENAILAGDIRYIVSRRSTGGFIIKLNKPAPEDIKFSWTAFVTSSSSSFTGSAPAQSQSTPTQTKDQNTTSTESNTNNTQTPTPQESTPSAQPITTQPEPNTQTPTPEASTTPTPSPEPNAQTPAE